MKVLFKFIVVVFMLFLGGNVYCQSSEHFDNAGKDTAINQTEKPSLEGEQNMQLQMELFNNIMHNKYSNYNTTNSNLTFEHPINLTVGTNGDEAVEFTILEEPKHYFDKNTNTHIPGSRYYERAGMDRDNPAFRLENFEPWCTGFTSGLGIQLNKKRKIPKL